MIKKDDALKLNVKILENKMSEKEKFIEILKSNFPSTFKDGEISLKSIATILGVSENLNGYELNWTGKALANALYQAPCKKDLSLINTEPNAQNHIIIGDNLDALKILDKAYHSKIKMIYIDPPYNTKNENFIYPDDFRKDYKEILKNLDLIEIDDDGNEVVSETLNFIKNIQSSKSHSGWLNFMLPRLKLARDLLKDDGVIFISIDDNEMANLKILCDEIFGEDNFIGTLIWKKTENIKMDSKYFSENKDYILCYKKYDLEGFNKILSDKSRYKLEDEKGKYYLRKLDSKSSSYSKGMDYIIEHDGVKYYAGGSFEKWEKRQTSGANKKDSIWLWSKEKFEKGLAENEIVFKNGNVYNKVRYNGIAKKPYTDFLDVSSGQSSQKNLDKLFDNRRIFDHPKPIYLICELLKMTTNPNDNDIILDFFAGSGTTAHAVMEQNLADNGNRKFILVQLDEKIDEKKSKTAYDFCKDELNSQNPVISDITIERVKRVISNLNTDTKFSIYEMKDKSNLVLENEQIKLNLSNLSPFDTARNMLLMCGKTLDKSIDEIIQDKLFICDGILVVIEGGKKVVEKLREYEDKEVILNGFADISFSDFENIKVIVGDSLRVVF
ncbi:site-specific DNA-methyltransferase [Campylobacter sp. FMV-PI01]|uniref:site-specific DNA-methyltransferase (adenine-specific) n=1 Tax=Campylobacter portucalensis TaxID=2608384 RepID=A0A6L5WKX8_9BACT|nr:site-specific DNA-methyltransferase [Campylobacter portucalensis]MSN97052.1 site-specific DNA-methyltransferase [Campylobacter portucalensis]